VIGFSSSAWTLKVSRFSGHANGFEVDAATAVDVARDRSGVIVFAGSLYNGAEIDRRYGACASDGERVLRVFRAKADPFAQQLRGVFAFVIREEATGVIVAGRDRLGIMPLFFFATAAEIIFSPSFRRLNARAEVSSQPNAVLLAEHLADLWTEPDETYTAGVRRVLPSTVMRFIQGKESIDHYWDPSEGAMESGPREVFEKFEQLLTAAVDRFMQMGKTGLFLSGGVDSISVAAVARRIARSSGLPLPTGLSLFYRDSETNEEEAQSFVARELGLPFVGSSLADALQQRPAMEMLLEASRDWPVPMWNLWLPAFLQLGALGRDAGCEVILTGGGGDEWLGVGPYLAADLLRSLRLVAFVRFIQHTHHSYSMPYPLVLRDLGWKFGAKQLVVGARNRILPALRYDIDGSRARRAFPAWLAPDPALRNVMVERLTRAKRAERLARNAAPSLYEFEARRSLHHAIVVSEIENKFAMGEAIGVKFFEPYWDADLVDLLYRTPPAILNQGGVAKGLVHRLVREALPSFTIPKQKKIALNLFYRKRVRQEAEAVWRATGGLPALSRLGLVDEKVFSSMVEKMLGGADTSDLWLIPHVLSVEAWARAR
jgi:asparagine synthetase B (glutamine-hydrolysing)